MARTLNRQPYSVDTDVDIKYKFFNHVNWKGLTDDKNYFNVDQETFEDCKNVYIDSDGLLKSRPSFKTTNITGSTKADEMWCFGDIIVLRVGSYIKIINGNKYTQSLVSNKVKITQIKNVIFIFTENNILMYDGTNIVDATDYLYIPITSVKTTVRNGDVITKAISKAEAENILTTSKATKYIFENVDKLTDAELVGKRLKITLNDKNYDVDFNELTSKTLFVDTGISVPESSNTDRLFAVGNVKYIVDIAEDSDVILVSQYSYDDKNAVDVWNVTAYFTDKSYINVQVPDGILSKPYISSDGSTVFVFKTDGVYCKSITAIAGNYEYPDWTSLYTFDKPLHSDCKAVGGKFKSPSNYTIAYVDYYGSISNLSQSYFIGYYIFTISNDKSYSVLYSTPSNWLIANDVILIDYVNIGSSIYAAINFSHSNTSFSALGDAVMITDVADTEKNTYAYSDKITSSETYSNDLAIKVNNDKKPIVFKTNNYSYNMYTIDKQTIVYGHPVTSSYSKLDKSVTVDLPALVTNDRYVYWYSNNIRNYKQENLLEEIEPIGSSKNYMYAVKDGKLYTTNLGGKNIDATYVEKGEIKPFAYDYICELNEKYFTKDNLLYISSTRMENDKPLLYIPTVNTQTFNNKITNIHPISNSQIAVFFNDEIWYTNVGESGYEYYKSKLQVGLKDGSDVITSPDGKNVIFSSNKGLVYMSYEELVQSTEQTLTYLSNGIFDTYEKFNKKSVKLFLHNFWLFCYNTDEKSFLIFDIRNNSWWKWEYYYPFLNILLIDDDPLFLSTNGFRKMDKSTSNYFDTEGPVHWFITSQKLHLGSLNYYKNVISIIINNVEPEDVTEDVSFNLAIKNYRLNVSNRYDEVQNLLYNVNMLRTFVKRCNSRKLNEFQYTLSSDTDYNGNAIQVPLSINSIIVKYTMSGQVR